MQCHEKNFIEEEEEEEERKLFKTAAHGPAEFLHLTANESQAMPTGSVTRFTKEAHQYHP